MRVCVDDVFDLDALVRDVESREVDTLDDEEPVNAWTE